MSDLDAQNHASHLFSPSTQCYNLPFETQFLTVIPVKELEHLTWTWYCVTALLHQHATQEDAVTSRTGPFGCGVTHRHGFKKGFETEDAVTGDATPLPHPSPRRVCVSSCPAGHYHADKKRCRKCAPNCESCFGSHGDQCLSCKHGYFLNEETNSCVPHCPNGSYQDTSEFISNSWF